MICWTSILIFMGFKNEIHYHIVNLHDEYGPSFTNFSDITNTYIRDGVVFFTVTINPIYYRNITVGLDPLQEKTDYIIFGNRTYRGTGLYKLYEKVQNKITEKVIDGLD